MFTGPDPVATAEAISSLGAVIQATGVVGVLLLVLILFVRGDLVTRHMLETLLKQNSAGIELLATKLQAAMKEAVRDGITAAREDINRDLADQLATVSKAVMSRPCILEIRDDDTTAHPHRRRTDRSEE